VRELINSRTQRKMEFSWGPTQLTQGAVDVYHIENYSLTHAYSKTCNYELSSEVFEHTQESCMWQPRYDPWERRLHEAWNYVCKTGHSGPHTASKTTERVSKGFATDMTHSKVSKNYILYYNSNKDKRQSRFCAWALGHKTDEGMVVHLQVFGSAWQWVGRFTSSPRYSLGPTDGRDENYPSSYRELKSGRPVLHSKSHR
jgi:hypothetical protein